MNRRENVWYKKLRSLFEFERKFSSENIQFWMDLFAGLYSARLNQLLFKSNEINVGTYLS